MQQRFSCIDNSPKTVVQYMSGKINSKKFIWNNPLSHLIPHFDGEIGSAHYSCYKCKLLKFIMCSHNEAIVLWRAVMNRAIWGVDCTGGTSGACVTSKRKIRALLEKPAWQVLKQDNVHPIQHGQVFSNTHEEGPYSSLWWGETGCQLWVQTIQFLGVVTKRLSHCDGPHNMGGLLHWQYQWRLRDRQK